MFIYKVDEFFGFGVFFCLFNFVVKINVNIKYVIMCLIVIYF